MGLGAGVMLAIVAAGLGAGLGLLAVRKRVREPISRRAYGTLVALGIAATAGLCQAC